MAVVQRIGLRPDRVARRNATCEATEKAETDTIRNRRCDANHAWIVGSSGTLLQWDGTVWGAESIGGYTTKLLGIGGSDATHLWSVGEGGMILAGDGTTSRRMPASTGAALYSVTATDATHAWIAGAGGTVLSWNGTRWTPQASGADNTLYGIWGSDISHLWTVGQNGTILEKLR